MSTHRQCCCSPIVSPCSHCDGYWATPSYLRITHDRLQCYGRTNPACYSLNRFREQQRWTVSSGCEAIRIEHWRWPPTAAKPLCDPYTPAWSTRLSGTDTYSVAEVGYLGTAWRVKRAGVDLSVPGDCCGGYYYVTTTGDECTGSPNGYYTTSWEEIVIEVSTTPFPAISTSLPDMPAPPEECNPLP
jgi:hypothetical protein